MSTKTGIALALAVVILALAGAGLVIAGVGGEKQSCPDGQKLEEVQAVHGKNHLRVEGPPGTVAGGGEQTVTVERNGARLRGPGKIELVCR